MSRLMSSAAWEAEARQKCQDEAERLRLAAVRGRERLIEIHKLLRSLKTKDVVKAMELLQLEIEQTEKPVSFHATLLPRSEDRFGISETLSVDMVIAGQWYSTRVKYDAPYPDVETVGRYALGNLTSEMMNDVMGEAAAVITKAYEGRDRT